MAGTLLLERLREAPTSAPVTLPEEDTEEAFRDLECRVDAVISSGREWLANVKKQIAKARKRKDQHANFLREWPELCQSITRSIQERQKRIQANDAWIAQVRAIDNENSPLLEEIFNRMGSALVEEHNEIIRIYYMLKADADHASKDTYGTGEELSSPQDVEAFFKRIRAA